MKVRMFTKSCSPDHVLKPGEVYHLPKEVALPLLEPGPFGQPYAELVRDSGVKARVPPEKPDPGDRGPESVGDEEFEELTDDDHKE